MTENQEKGNNRTTPQLSRRHFLKISAAGMAAAAFKIVGVDLSAQQAAAALARRQSGILGVGWGGSPATLDPLSASADVEIAFLNVVYDYLIDTNASSELVPRLASSWSVSDDGLTYTLQLQDGVTFHDGSALMPDDVVWTFERLKSDGPTADLYANVVSVAAGDGNSVVFTLEQTNPDFLYNLTDNHAVILKANADNIGTDFNGTGPFRLTDFAVDRAVFEANASYWGGTPGVETLEFIYFDSVDGAINALQAGAGVDVVLRMDNAVYLSLAGDSFFQANEVPTSGHDLVRLRADRAPGNDERVRQAFRLATDRQAIFDRIQFGFGAVGRDSPIGPVFAQYYTEETPLPERDPAAARQLLTDAGYPDGLDMTLYVPALSDRVALAEVLAAQWADAGINITIEPQEEAVYYADSGWLEVDLGITPWGARPVPQVYLDLYLKSDAVWNEAHWSDEEIDRLVETAGTTLDEAERVNAYHEIQRVMIERGPIIIPYFFAQFGVMAEYVDGVDLHPFAGRTNFNTATV
ncbi:MAG: ABC transporter substrate-binding protein [Chloroflexi bacterium]|nr:ABC transporter substrate-binding protein [Chloroflexota bacterium]